MCRNKTTKLIRDWIRNHQCYGAYPHLEELQLGDTETYINFLLMNSSTFEKLPSLVGPQITFHDTYLQEAIPAWEISWFTFSAVRVDTVVLYVCI